MTLFDTATANMPADIPGSTQLIANRLWQQKTNATLTGDICHRCHTVVLRGEETHGVPTTLDAHPLTPTNELTALLTGRATWRLWHPEPTALQASLRYAPDITTHPANPTATPTALRSGPTGTPAVVLTTHRCHQPLSTHPLRLRDGPATTAAFPDQPTY